MMTEMSWGDAEDLALSRWIPNSFAILQSDATLRSPTTPAADILQNHPAMASLLSPWEWTVLSDPKYGDVLTDLIRDRFNLRASATPPPADENIPVADPGSVASA
eukprot:5015195-Pyramimonas_sp.AAC.1